MQNNALRVRGLETILDSEETVSEIFSEDLKVPGFGFWLLNCPLENTAVSLNPNEGFEESTPIITKHVFV